VVSAVVALLVLGWFEYDKRYNTREYQRCVGWQRGMAPWNQLSSDN
jgi:hypothetical protein